MRQLAIDGFADRVSLPANSNVFFKIFGRQRFERGKDRLPAPLPKLHQRFTCVAFTDKLAVPVAKILFPVRDQKIRPRGDVAVLMITFLLTIFIELTVGIQVGVLLAGFLFLQKMSNETHVDLITQNFKDDDETETRDISNLQIPNGVEVFEIYGSLFFGAVSQFKESIRIVADKQHVERARGQDLAAG